MTEFNTENNPKSVTNFNSSIHSSEFNELFHSDSTSSDQKPYWLDSFPEIVGRSPLMLKVLDTVYKIASSNSSVLINGESGTGKELIAAAIHRLSKRASKKFVAINCSAIPEDLLESELFGHEKGAFTGAVSKRLGVFGQADGGTLFLDEIGDMPIRLQSKLLRVLQDKKFTPLGGQNLYCSDVRIIAATNVDLYKAVLKNKFRLDLYYRLNVLPVYIPPLRERPEDIPDLLNKFLQNTNKINSRSCHFSSEAVELLCKYPWPGNVRELQNLVERMSILAKNSIITVDNLPDTYKNYIYQNTMEEKSISSSSTGSYLDTPSSMKVVSSTILPLSSNTNSLTNSLNLNLQVNSKLNTKDKDKNKSIDKNMDTDKSKTTEYDFSNIELPQEGIDIVNYIEQLENHLTLQALHKTSNNKNQAAKLLGLNRTTLVERIKKRKLIQLQEPSREL